MKRRLLFALPVFIVFTSVFLGGYARAKDKHAPPWARTIDPIVSTDWLHGCLSGTGDDCPENLAILDVRTVFEYDAGHILGSISAPFMTFSGAPPAPTFTSGWIVVRDGLLLEVPEADALLEYIGGLGITNDSAVVIVTVQDPPPNPPQYGLSSATRVAFTLEYAGFKNYAILDGGYAKWVAEGRPTTTDVPVVDPVTYQGKIDEAMIVSGKYVRRHLWSADIIDARDADVYFGVTIEPFAPKAGHIPWAKSLPAPWIWDLNSDGTYYTYKDPETLGAMASGVIGEPWGYKGKGHWDQEIIVYCGVGGYASSWWFVLTQVLGYRKVKLYDGSAQEWAGADFLDYDMVPYQWD